MKTLIKLVKTSLFFKMRSAFGQLIVLVFVPIVLLAMVGGLLVFKEVREATLAQQDDLANNALLNYEIVLIRHFSDASKVNSTTLVVPAFEEFFHKISPKQVRRMGIFNEQYQTLAVYGGYDDDEPLDVDELLKKDNHFKRQKTTYGTSYAQAMSFHGVPYYVVVEMDNNPITITYYRVAMALVITGLITLLLLLLVLAIYSKRWIAPIYEMRMYLQRLTADNLLVKNHYKPDGEFFLLQLDFVQAMRRLNVSFEELKSHAEETESYLQQAFDEMEMQNISIRKAHDLAVSTSQAKSAFLTNISHELRTPLNSIDGFINLLDRNGGLSGEQKLYVQTIKKSSAHLLALVNDVLDFSKMEAGKLVLDSHRFDLYTTIYDVVDMLSPSALEKHLRLSVLFYHDVPTVVVGDSLRIKQILTNLVGNAIKFTDSGSVTVKVALCEEQDGFLRISVEDTGKGISDADKVGLFQSFSQGDLSITRKYGGTGLGLVISKELIGLMGGDIGFFDNNQQNIAKQGTTFWCQIPTNIDDGESEFLQGLVLPDVSLNLLVWINHEPAMQVLKASLPTAKIHFAIGLADLLEQLDNPNHGFNWVLVDYFGQDAAKDDVGAILRQIRQRYQGNLSAYGYQVGMDTVMLEECQTYALYEPMDARQLNAMFTKQVSHTRLKQHRFVGVRALAVDDHEPNLLVLTALLSELGVEVVSASSGFDAIQIMSRAISGAGVSIDLVFMDIQMPKMSGLEASLQIRKIEEAHNAPPIPIIALTAHGLADEKERLVKAGMSDYAGKPIGQEQLLQLLQKWLNQDECTPFAPQPSMDSVIASVESSPMIASTLTTSTPANVDWQDALNRCANKPDLAKNLLTMIIQSADSEKQALERAWADRDKTALIDITHRMVGASRYTGVPRLRQMAEDFESKAYAQNLTSASSFIAIRPSYRALIDALDALGTVSLDEILPK